MPFKGFCLALHGKFLMFLSVGQCYTKAKPTILEPVMLVDLKVPLEFQGSVTGDINKCVFSIFFSTPVKLYGICQLKRVCDFE